MKTDYSIVRQDRFIEATRDSGYKSTESALSELIDNSIQARASSVAIEFVTLDEASDGPGRPKMPRIMEVLIADNGHGMDSDTLRRSLRFGDSSRFGDRNGLGRFGMGLPNASVSQCERVEVYSWRRGAKPLHTFIDVELIAKGEQEEVPEPREAVIPAPYAHLCTSPSGTLVVWKRCDRLDHDGKSETLVKTLRSNLGRIFRYFLIRDFDLTINGDAVGPMDPLYLMPQARLSGDALATQHGDTMKFEVPIPGKPDQTSTVEVVFTLLPEEWHTKFGGRPKEQRSGNLARQIDKTAGFSFVRAWREIDLTPSPYRVKHHLHRWYRVEVRFSPELDELFGVTHTKQHARLVPGTALSNILEKAITLNEATLIDTIEGWTRKAAASKRGGPSPAEEYAKQVAGQMKPVEGLADKPTSEVKQEIAAFVHERASASGSPAEATADLDQRLSQFPIIIERESLPGAPIYRVKVVGRTIVVMLNTAHPFYERVYKRLEDHSSVGRTGVDLLLMSLARSEVNGSEEARDWYDAQRQDWSQNLKLLTSQLPEYEGLDSPGGK
ncbi:MAG: ATP-binding protein [Phycisphaerales bacterium]|nr:ATP-binding protein [Phycisphaerales bacterium]